MVSLYDGSYGFKDICLIESAIARPKATFGGQDLYTSIFLKAAAFFNSLIMHLLMKTKEQQYQLQSIF